MASKIAAASSKIGLVRRNRSDLRCIIRRSLKEVALPKYLDRPVAIFVGLGFPHEVETLLEAFHVLTEWTGKRGPDHVQATASCREALAGRIDVSQAREDFETFALNQGILASEALAAAAARHAREWQPAG